MGGEKIALKPILLDAFVFLSFHSQYSASLVFAGKIIPVTYYVWLFQKLFLMLLCDLFL